MHAIYGIPYAVFWVVGIISIAIGLWSIVQPDRVVRALRSLLIRQLRWVRSARYRLYLKVNGWLLFVLGVLVLVLMTLLSRFPSV